LALDLGEAAPSRARALVAGQDLAVTRGEDGLTRLVVPRLGDFEAIVLGG
jgi:hypothetical protein